MKPVKKISDFKLERYLLGELPEAEMRELKEREAVDDLFAARIKQLREENGRILAECPFSALEDRLDGVTPAEGRNSYGFYLKVAAALVIALGVFSMVLLNRDVTTCESVGTSMEVAMADIDNGTRIKGLSPRLEVWKKTGDSAVQMQNKDNAYEGDELQLRYAVPEKCFGLLFSMDGNGVLTLHMGEGNSAVALEPGKMTTLPFAYKLDNAPHFEKFFLVTSKNTFSIDGEDIDNSLKQDGLEISTFVVRKVRK